LLESAETVLSNGYVAHRVYRATVRYQAGFLGRDYTTVKVTKTDCCTHHMAYECAGPAEPNSTILSWIDDSHLQIEYRADPGLLHQHCETHVEKITIVCKMHAAGVPSR
jgi:hypothetical protein